MSKSRWEKEEIDFVEKNYGIVPLEKMARRLGRSAMAVRLYVLRHRLDAKHQMVKENRLKKLLDYRFRHIEDFQPSRYFFKETGINQMRYWDLYFGRKAITPEEYKAVADYFNITKAEAFDSMQLDLFDQ